MAQDLPEWLITGREAEFLEWFIQGKATQKSAFGPVEIAAYVNARPGALRAAFDWFRAFWQDADDNRIFARTKLEMPVLAIGSAVSVGEALAKSLTPLAAEVHSLVAKGCGHFIPEERPEFLSDELLKFFSA